MRRVASEQLQLDLSQPQPEPTEATRRTLLSQSTETDAGAHAGSNGARAHARCHSAAELIQTPGAVLTRSHLRELGWERRGVDAIFRALPVVAVEGYSRPVIQVEDYLRLLEQSTFRDDRVRPMASATSAPPSPPFYA